MPSLLKNIAFIGLGRVGTPISRHLLKAGYGVTGYDIVREKIGALEPDGLMSASSPAEAARAADVIFTMLNHPDIIRQVLYGDDCIVKTAQPGAIVADMSTMSIAFQKERFAQLSALGFRPFEAPVSGSVPHAEARALTIMGAGDEAVFAELRPLFATFGKTVVYMGAAGTGTLMKLLTNLILGINLAGLLEGLILGQKGGLKIEGMLEILKTGAAFSRVMEFKEELLTSRDFTGKLQLTTELFTKDLRFALEAGQELGATPARGHSIAGPHLRKPSR